MGNLPKTAIIIPCYNESRRLNLQKFELSVKAESNLHFIFVNDGSTDDTYEMLVKVCRNYQNQCHLINLGENCGKAEAVRKGVLKAIEDNFSNIGYWDADLSTPLEYIKSFSEIVEKHNKYLVLGSRVLLLGHDIKRKASRHYLGRIFATCASLILRIPVYDTQCGAKLFKNTDELKKIFSVPFSSKWIFDVEILARFKKLYLSKDKTFFKNHVFEIPLMQWHEIGGSKLKKRDYFRAAFELLKLYIVLQSSKLQKF
jgi:glycosyltransferase involved in cell wall biosynthesis